MKKRVLKLHYSGEESKTFWQIVNTMNNGGRDNTAFALGVALQNLEGQVLKYIHDEGGPGFVAPLYWFNKPVERLDSKRRKK